MSARKVLVLPLLSLALGGCAAEQSQLAAQAAPPEWGQWATTCEDWDEWDKPGPAFRIHGNSYYVGTCGIGAILLQDAQGLVLIDSGTEAGAEVVLANIRALGFDPKRARLLLSSHEHHDHVGGMARLQAATGAPLAVSPAAVDTMRTGQPNPDDPQAAISPAMPPVPVVQPLDGQPISSVLFSEQGFSHGLTLKPIATPGHTPGATSWSWTSCDEAGTCKTIVYADSLSPISDDSYRFSDHPDYVQAFRDGITRLAALDCDIVITPHPSASGMRDKLVAGDLSSGPDCREYAASVAARLDARLAEEAGARP